MPVQPLAVLCLAVTAFALTPLPLSGQRRGKVAGEQRIQAGTSIQDARTILAAARVVQGGARAFAAHPSGDQWSFYTLREDKVDLVLRYSPRTQKVTELTLYYLADRRTKSSDIAVTASVVQFYQNGSYAVLFPPPRRKAHLEEG